MIADKGYRGEAEHIVTPTGDRSLDLGGPVRGRHETVNKRFKQFGILRRIFRHNVNKHQPAFAAVVVITQLSLENGEPLFAVV